MAAISSETEHTYQAPWTYSGLIDDVVARYPVSDTVDDDFFNKMLAKNIFFSGGVLLNDGYLLNHPVARRELMREDSVLRTMLQVDFVRLLTRMPQPDGLIEMPQRMAEQGNRSFQELVNGPEWASLLAVTRRIGPFLYRKGNLVSWPRRQMHVGFTRLMRRTFGKTHKDLGLTAAADVDLQELEEAFERQLPEDGGPRDKFEKAVQEVVSKRSSHPREAAIALMNIANQCYHYNFGMCLSPELEQPVTVDTSIGLAFEDILELDEVYSGHIEDVLPRIPFIQVPRSIPFDSGPIFAAVLDSSTRVGTAKEEYLRSIDAIFAVVRDPDAPGVAIQNQLQDAREAADKYRRRLAEHFGANAPSRFWESWLDSAITVGVGGLGELVGAGATAGIALGIASSQILRRPREFLLRRIRARDLDNQMRSPPLSDQPTDPAMQDIKPLFASMAFNRQVSDAFAESVPSIASYEDAI